MKKHFTIATLLTITYSNIAFAATITSKSDLENEMEKITSSVTERTECNTGFLPLYSQARANGVNISKEEAEEYVRGCMNEFAKREKNKFEQDAAKLSKLGLFATTENLKEVGRPFSKLTNLAEVNRACTIFPSFLDKYEITNMMWVGSTLAKKGVGNEDYKNLQDVYKLTTKKNVYNTCFAFSTDYVPDVKREVLDPLLMQNKVMECASLCTEFHLKQLPYLKDKSNWKFK